jgi:hypothetical protein
MSLVVAIQGARVERAARSPLSLPYPQNQVKRWALIIPIIEVLYTVLPATEMDGPLTREMWLGLAPHEQKLVRYFRPRRVGDVVYNYWD